MRKDFATGVVPARDRLMFGIRARRGRDARHRKIYSHRSGLLIARQGFGLFYKFVALPFAVFGDEAPGLCSLGLGLGLAAD